MLYENFRVFRPVGTGHSWPNDVKRIRRALNRTGHASSPPEPSGHYNATAIASIERFQRDFGLKPDGVVLPGGPTERALDMALAARRQGGPVAQDQLRDVMKTLADKGLTFRPADRNDDRPGVFVDRSGTVASPERLQSLLDQRGTKRPAARPGEIQVAGGPAAIPAIIAGAEEVSSVLGTLIGITIPSLIPDIDPKTAARNAEERDAATRSIANHAAAQRRRRDAAGARRRAIEPSPTIFPGGTELPKLPDRTETPAEPLKDFGKPGHLPPALPEQTNVLPGKEIKPAKPEILVNVPPLKEEFAKELLILERAGPPWLRRFNHLLGRRIKRRGKEMGVDVSVQGGGYPTDDDVPEDTDLQYQRETYLPPHKSLKVDSKPTKNSSYIDLEIGNNANGRRALINTQTMTKGGQPIANERRQVEKALLNKRTEDIFDGFPKPPRDADIEKFIDDHGEWIDNIIRQLAKEPPARQ